jgi:hypothetical protein
MQIICQDCGNEDGMDLYEINRNSICDTEEFNFPLEFLRYELECLECGHLFIFETEAELNNYVLEGIDG